MDAVPTFQPGRRGGGGGNDRVGSRSFRKGESSFPAGPNRFCESSRTGEGAPQKLPRRAGGMEQEGSVSFHGPNTQIHLYLNINTCVFSVHVAAIAPSSLALPHRCSFPRKGVFITFFLPRLEGPRTEGVTTVQTLQPSKENPVL